MAKINRRYYASVQTDTLSEERNIRSSNYSPTEFIKKNDVEHEEDISDIKIVYFKEGNYIPVYTTAKFSCKISKNLVLKHYIL